MYTTDTAKVTLYTTDTAKVTLYTTDTANVTLYTTDTANVTQTNQRQMSVISPFMLSLKQYMTN